MSSFFSKQDIGLVEEVKKNSFQKPNQNNHLHDFHNQLLRKQLKKQYRNNNMAGHEHPDSPHL